MKTGIFALLLSLGLVGGYAAAQGSRVAGDALLQKYMESTFGNASPEWRARIVPDETIAACNTYRNAVPAGVAASIVARERARIVFPPDGTWLGNWKDGARIANNGQGGQFSDPAGTVSGGNCYACHQLDPAEVSFGTLGPSLKGYGRARNFEPEEAKAAFAKIYDAQSVIACSIMPRFGANKVLTEQQIEDVVAYLFDRDSPVNK